jgi:transglutaminase-like putative cysteine protease
MILAGNLFNLTMKIWVASSLHYYVSGPSTLLCSLSCMETSCQRILEESLTISRNDVVRSDIKLGLDAVRYTKLEVNERGELGLSYNATLQLKVNTVGIGKISEGENFNSAALPYIFPSRYVPSDRMRAVANDLFANVSGKFAQALAIEDWLFKNIYYQVGISNEQSWALDTLETRSGVCRDFAHLGIAFCRALSIPARYVTVYAYGLYPQDFHAVFEVFVDGIWYLMDGTRKAPLNGMVSIARGRDAADAAVATLFGNVMGQSMMVQSEIATDEDEIFMPITREMLMRDGNALYLG